MGDRTKRRERSGFLFYPIRRMIPNNRDPLLTRLCKQLFSLSFEILDLFDPGRWDFGPLSKPFAYEAKRWICDKQFPLESSISCFVSNECSDSAG